MPTRMAEDFLDSKNEISSVSAEEFLSNIKTKTETVSAEDFLSDKVSKEQVTAEDFLSSLPSKSVKSLRDILSFPIEKLPSKLITFPAEQIISVSEKGRQLEELANKQIEEALYKPSEHPVARAIGLGLLKGGLELAPKTPEAGLEYAATGEVLSLAEKFLINKFPFLGKSISSLFGKKSILEIPTTIEPVKVDIAPVEAKPSEAPITPSEAGKSQIEPISGKPRGFLETIKESPQSAEKTIELTRSIQPQEYVQITNKQSLKVADDIINQSEDMAKKELFDVPLTEANGATKGAIAIRLLKKYENEGRDDELLKLLDQSDKIFRAGGRLVQVASLWNNLSPSGMVRMANKVAEKSGKELTKDFQKSILNRMKKIDGMNDSPEKTDATIQMLKDIAQNIPPTKMEIFDSYRYQNMLSSPITHIKNIYHNLFNTFTVRPATLGVRAVVDMATHPLNPMARDVHFSDIPIYIKNSLTSVPDAFLAMKEAFKVGTGKKFDIPDIAGKNIIEQMRMANMPKIVSITTRLLEMEDKFVTTMISAGEKARLLSHDISEKEANNKAIDLAEKYLFRDRLKLDKENSGYIVRALDSLGRYVLAGRKLDIVGKPYSWFVPFVTVPINVSKFMVENSPIGIIGGKLNQERVAQSLVGSAFVGFGAIMAMNDKTSWAAPKTEKGKMLFYGTGRKPYSIEVNGKWIPMFYFGPYALSIAIPAAIKYYTEDSGESISDDQITKISRIIGDSSKFFMSQSSLSGVSSFFKIIEGDEDFDIDKIAGFTAGQVIPAEGFVRYINSIIDPVYRKTKGFTESLQKDIPILSKGLIPHITPEGEKAKRNLSNYIFPYGIGIADTRFEENYKKIVEKEKASNFISGLRREEIKRQYKNGIIFK